ncbi:MAG: hypothetical protein QOH34_348 [Mycobacterium sp.]|nr:hypothetical protein [Mycobacterium sp.]
MTLSSARTLLAGVVAIILVAITGCTPDVPEKEHESPPAGWPTSLDSFTIAWTAEPRIDLATDKAAIAVRAYVESYYLSKITVDEKYLYPGFADAVEPDQPGGPPGTSNLHPRLGSSDPDVWYGTVRHHVLGIARSGDDVTVVACAYLYGSARKSPNSQGYTANVGIYDEPNSGIFPMRIGLRAPADGASKTPPQEGPSKAPYDNVFGGWKITNFMFDYLSQPTSWPEKNADLAACIAKADGPPESRHFTPRQPYPLSDFPTLPATPGWPAKPAS